MDCREMREQFSAYLDGELSEQEHALVSAHLERCSACRQELDALRQTVELMRKVPRAKAPPFLAERTVAKVEKEAAHEYMRPLPLRRYILWPSLAAAVALALTLFYREPVHRPALKQQNAYRAADKADEKVSGRREGQTELYAREQRHRPTTANGDVGGLKEALAGAAPVQKDETESEVALVTPAAPPAFTLSTALRLGAGAALTADDERMAALAARQPPSYVLEVAELDDAIVAVREVLQRVGAREIEAAQALADRPPVEARERLRERGAQPPVAEAQLAPPPQEWQILALVPAANQDRLIRELGALGKLAAASTERVAVKEMTTAKPPLSGMAAPDGTQMNFARRAADSGHAQTMGGTPRQAAAAPDIKPGMPKAAEEKEVATKQPLPARPADAAHEAKVAQTEERPEEDYLRVRLVVRPVPVRVPEKALQRRTDQPQSPVEK